MIQEVPEVFFVDDPKLFGTLGKVFPNAKLVQDGWHLEDRYSRCIPPNNTLKGSTVLQLIIILFIDWQAVRKAIVVKTGLDAMATC